MFRREVRDIRAILNITLRKNGLEMPLLQKRLIDAWGSVAGKTAERYTADKFIKNQTLFVKITNPALRADISMARSELVRRLNETVGTMLITEIKVY